MHTVKGIGIVNKAEIDVFLELSCFFYDPADVGNLIAGSHRYMKDNENKARLRNHMLPRGFPGWH